MIVFIIVRNFLFWPAKTFVWRRVNQTLHYLKRQNKTTLTKKTLLDEKKKKRRKKKKKKKRKEETKKKRRIRPETNSQSPTRRAISLLMRQVIYCD